MPWTAQDAKKHTAKANSPAKQARWATIANRVLSQTGDEARAIRAANSAMMMRPRRKEKRNA